MDFLEIVIATNNENKVREYKEIFQNFPVKVTSLKEENIILDVEETGTTFEENALIKARGVVPFTKKIVIADDSGLCINALNGQPGIYSSRFKENRPYIEKQQALLDMLENYDDKSAYFICTIALIINQEEHIFVGKIDGDIVPIRKGNYGFGYDPIFLPKGYNLTFNQMEDDLKNQISHRGKASKLLLDYIKTLI